MGRPVVRIAFLVPAIVPLLLGMEPVPPLVLPGVPGSAYRAQAKQQEEGGSVGRLTNKTVGSLEREGSWGEANLQLPMIGCTLERTP